MQLNLEYLPSVGWSDQIDVDTSKVVPCSPISLFVFCSGIIPSKKTSWKYKIQNAKHKVENTKSKKQNAKLKIQNEKYKIQHSKCKIQNKNVEFKSQNTKCLALFARHIAQYQYQKPTLYQGMIFSVTWSSVRTITMFGKSAAKARGRRRRIKETILKASTGVWYRNLSFIFHSKMSSVNFHQ